MGNTSSTANNKNNKKILKQIAQKYKIEKKSLQDLYKVLAHNIQREKLTEEEILFSLDVWPKYLTLTVRQHIFAYIQRKYNKKQYYKKMYSTKQKNKQGQVISHTRQIASTAFVRTASPDDKGVLTDVGLAEYIAWMVELTNGPPSTRIEFMFHMLDIHGAGTLDLDDIIRMCNLLFRKIRGDRTSKGQRKKIAYKLFHAMDRHHRNAITLSQFRSVVSGKPELHRAIMSIARPLYSKKYFRKFTQKGRSLASRGSSRFSRKSSMFSSRPSSRSSAFTVELESALPADTPRPFEVMDVQTLLEENDAYSSSSSRPSSTSTGRSKRSPRLVVDTTPKKPYKKLQPVIDSPIIKMYYKQNIAA